MEAFNWRLGLEVLLVVCLLVSFFCHVATFYALQHPKHQPSLSGRLAQELHEQQAENALLQYERGEFVRKLEEMDGRLRLSENENRLLRRRVVVLEDLVAVRDAQLKMERLGKDPVIGKCEEALEKLKGSAA